LEKLGLGENPLLASAESVKEAAGAHSQLYFFFAIWEEVEEWRLDSCFL
jgi:hypothetical protein